MSRIGLQTTCEHMREQLSTGAACSLSDHPSMQVQSNCKHLQDFQDLSQLSRDAVRPYVLPWDVSKLLKCLNGLLSPKPACFGYHEPSLFCTTWGVVHPLPEDAQ